jgi:hypothetical protein
VGYCGLDRERVPLSGDEIRACWESSVDLAEAPGPATAQPDVIRTAVPHREFVEVKAAARATSHGRVRLSPDPASATDPLPAAVAPRWSLWEDVDG